MFRFTPPEDTSTSIFGSRFCVLILNAAGIVTGEIGAALPRYRADRIADGFNRRELFDGTRAEVRPVSVVVQVS